MKPELVPPHNIEQIVHPTHPSLPDGAILPKRDSLNILKYRAANLFEKQRFKALINRLTSPQQDASDQKPGPGTS